MRLLHRVLPKGRPRDVAEGLDAGGHQQLVHLDSLGLALALFHLDSDHIHIGIVGQLQVAQGVAGQSICTQLKYKHIRIKSMNERQYQRLKCILLIITLGKNSEMA